MGIPVLAWLSILGFALAYFTSSSEIRIIACVISTAFGAIALLYYVKYWNKPTEYDYE